MKKLIVIISLGFYATSYAATALSANPQHVELFNQRNFCVLCTFNDAVLSPDTLYGAAHSNANISGTYVYGTTMDRLDLTFAFMYAVKGEHFTIKNSNVKMINLTYSDLPYFAFTGNEGALANFTGSGLNYGNFRDAKLEYPIFAGTALEDTDFTGAHLMHANFENTWQRNTNFTDANLAYANFKNAYVEGVNFTRANLLGATLTDEQLQNAIICDAILPDGSVGTCQVDNYQYIS